MQRARQAYVVLGRDGVIHRRLAHGEVLRWEQVEFLPRALDALRLLNEHDYGVLVIAKQEGVLQGLLLPGELDQLIQRLLLEVALEGGRIDRVYSCTHAAEENCDCRPPAAGLLRRAIADYQLGVADTYLVSDCSNDLASGATVGFPGILLDREAFLRPGDTNEADCEVATNLHEAVERILSRIPPLFRTTVEVRKRERLHDPLVSAFLGCER